MLDRSLACEHAVDRLSLFEVHDIESYMLAETHIRVVLARVDRVREHAKFPHVGNLFDHMLISWIEDCERGRGPQVETLPIGTDDAVVRSCPHLDAPQLIPRCAVDHHEATVVRLFPPTRRREDLAPI